MKILALGATGLIGHAICKDCLIQGHHIGALARSKSAENKLSEIGVEIVRGDLRDPTNWSSIIHQVDAIIHAAATFTPDMGYVDRLLIQELLRESDSSKKPTRLLYTQVVFGYMAIQGKRLRMNSFRSIHPLDSNG